MSTDADFHYGTVKKSIRINSSNDKVWEKISNIIGLSWLVGVKKTIFLSNEKREPGATRKITFDDGNNVFETVVGWNDKKYFSYIATKGLPLRAYHATISMHSIEKKLVKVTWQSFFNSEKMSKKEFLEFHKFMSDFYRNSLVNLKSSLENS